MFKNLLRELCHRGLTVLLDEYKTSKMCPCGHDELKTTGYRFRAHKGDGAACPLLTRLGARSCDRDALASLNMVSCALCALGGRTRPEHLCRSKCMPCLVSILRHGYDLSRGEMHHIVRPGGAASRASDRAHRRRRGRDARAPHGMGRGRHDATPSS